MVVPMHTWECSRNTNAVFHLCVFTLILHSMHSSELPHVPGAGLKAPCLPSEREQSGWEKNRETDTAHRRLNEALEGQTQDGVDWHEFPEGPKGASHVEEGRETWKEGAASPRGLEKREKHTQGQTTWGWDGHRRKTQEPKKETGRGEQPTGPTPEGNGASENVWWRDGTIGLAPWKHLSGW